MDTNMPRSDVKALCLPPILVYPRPGEEFIVDADASTIGVGEVLSQRWRTTDNIEARKKFFRNQEESVSRSEDREIPVWIKV